MVESLCIVYGGVVVMLLAYWANKRKELEGDRWALARIILWPILVPLTLGLLIVFLIVMWAESWQRKTGKEEE